MIFKSPNKQPTQDNGQVDQSLQSDEELAKVLAEIDNQVNQASASQNNLADDLVKAVEAENNPQSTSTEQASASASGQPSDKVNDLPKMTEYRPDATASEATMPASSDIATMETLETVSADAARADQAAPANLDTTPRIITKSSGRVNEPSTTANEPSVRINTQPRPVPFEGPIKLESIKAERPQAEVKSSEIKQPVTANDYDDLRKKALVDLRPVIDKIELEDGETFDVLLLLIRETDDETLLPRVYEAARKIRDESRRAQALLDVIKETDYFKNR